jgi:acyl-CoA thioester hydrolase
VSDPSVPASSPPRAWPDLAGRTEGAHHLLPVRVYYEDTDFSGLAYHASYLRWCERGRSDWLRLLGIHHHQLAAAQNPAAFVVRKLTIDYLKPARIDEVLEVVSACAGLTTATLTLAQEVRRDSVLLAKVEVLVVLVSAAGRPLRLPAGVREAFGVPVGF